MTLLQTAGQSVLEAFFMFWATLWALIFGFTLSGAVQAFVSRHEMQKAMGDHRAGTVVRTGFLGAASSSCSYAATALAKSLFQRGADFTTAMVFMVASTNLVVELGIVLWLLIGWQFALAEFVGGAIMIALFVLIAPRVFPAAELAQARERLNARASAKGHAAESDEAERHGVSLRQRLRSKAGWADAAGYAVSDVSMLRRELLIGYLVAGILAVAVPASAYSVVFFSGHGFWTDLENVIVGPFVAFISFVCSIGNVPLAAALFKGGLSFGGTVAFVFADLIALPLVIIYGKFYGRRIASRIFFSFWAVMSVSGLIVDLLFRALGIPAPDRPTEIARTSFEWNYTTWLNIAAIAVGAVVYWLYRNREHFGGMEKYAKDPVCGMQVERAHAPAIHTHAGSTYYFCSDRCHEKFVNDPGKYINQSAAEPMPPESSASEPKANRGEESPRIPQEDTGLAGGTGTDPVCGMSVDTASPGAAHVHHGRTYYFCSEGCRDTFAADPARYSRV
ncbi:permease [Arthrobacter sp. FW306-06-A]|uniref:permease n=1 Tax=Arthrobacter sp. FW306-06-A TaxID=2879621 RepID=UPI001F22D69B|nr:permease [Arthrobacter sp. FW306-06-A]UKA73530.1 permease [Arthrobacter sp. FW306-06-A]